MFNRVKYFITKTYKQQYKKNDMFKKSKMKIIDLNKQLSLRYMNHSYPFLFVDKIKRK